mmetsp:Transcript_35662/g.79328  ORF Transcript_35662/g.79328 Transcript_35662/m.79328 type:complete len:292 (-) Transcript_35662:974-1849(-)
MCVGSHCGRLNLLPCCQAVLSVRNVVCNGPCKQDRLLADHGHSARPLAAREGVGGRPIQVDTPLLGLVEPGQQVGHGALAGPAAPHQRRHTAHRQRQHQALQHRYFRAHWVRKVHVPQLQGAAAGCQHRPVTGSVRVRLDGGPGAVGHLPPRTGGECSVHGGVRFRASQDLADPGQGPGRSPQLRQRVDDALRGVHEAEGEADAADHDANGHQALVHQPPAPAIQREQGEVDGGAVGGLKPGLGTCECTAGLVGGRHVSLEALTLEGLTGKGPHSPDVLNRLQRHAGHALQ